MTTLRAKIYCMALAGSIGVSDTVTAGEAARLAAEGTFSVVERGAHHRTWQRDEVIQLPNGTMLNRPHKYVELATGMHFWDGQWRESRELVEPLATGGAVARYGQHQVIFAENLNTLGAIELTTPDGKRLRSHVLGLAFTDAASGQSVMVATIKDSVGEIVGGNQVLYRDAFTSVVGVRADIRFSYTRAGLEQDVIIRSGGNLLRPSAVGLADATSRLQAFTEFVEAPAPKQQQSAIKPGFTDVRLNFGMMQIGSGVAFATGANADAAEVPVGKSWELRDGRKFLIESVEYSGVAPKLDALRQANAGNAGEDASKMLAARPAPLAKPVSSALLARSFTPPPAREAKSEPMRMAKLAAPESGFVIDYTIATSETNSFTFKGDTTYLLSSVVNMSGPLTEFEGGAVLKFSNRDGSSPRLVLKGDTLFRTSAYRTVLFTAVDDNTVGECIGSGYPSGWYADMALGLDNTSLSFNVSNIVVKYAWWGVYGFNNNQYDLINGQFVTCNQATRSQGRATYRNCLFSYCNNALLLNAAVTNIGEHLTMAQCGRVNLANADYLFLTNCLVVATTNVGDFAASSSHVQSNASFSAVFQTAGLARHYLKDGSSYRGAGSTNINPALRAELSRRTTYPPKVLTNNVTVDTVLSPQVPRDTDTPDLGYHYGALDFLFGNLVVSNATLVLTNGVAVGAIFESLFDAGSWGFVLTAGKVVSEGAALNPNHIVRAHMVQERCEGSPGYRAMFYDGYATSRNSEVRLRFTEYAQAAEDGYSIYAGEKFSAVEVTHSSIYNAPFVLVMTGSGTMVCGLTNTLWDRAGLLWLGPTSSSSLHLRNNLFHNVSSFHLIDGSTAWTARDNVFDHSYVDDHGGTISNSHNAFIQISGPGLGGSISSTNLSSLTYDIGPLGDFYQPTNSPLIGLGSRNANLAGLYHFTTTTNQVKEANSTVDIGWHAVALTNFNGEFRPVDTDRDGLEDFVEDKDGDGVMDTGETDFTKERTDGETRDDIATDQSPPVIQITNPDFVTAQTRIHLEGYSDEPLLKITYSIYTNGVVSDSGNGAVTDQTYDAYARRFTRNYFRCYDLPLAVGLNTVVLQATDLNGNVSTNTLSYTVDFDIETSAPTATLQWPTNGMQVSGTTFTMSGLIDNPSATVVVTIASTNSTNEFYGAASTSGQLWIPDVSLGSGTNTVTIVSTSPGGRSKTNTLNLVASPIQLTIDENSNGISSLNADRDGTMTGRIYSGGYTVSVNGVTATQSQDQSNPNLYYWSANVPGNENGWMEVLVTAVPSGGGAPVTAQYEWDKPPVLRLKEYHLETGFVGTGPQTYRTETERLDYKRKEGGSYIKSTVDGTDGCTESYGWAPNDVFTNYLVTCLNGFSTTNPGAFNPGPPTFGELADAVESKEDGEFFWTFNRMVKQILEVRTGGKPYGGLKNLFVFNVSAYATNFPFTYDAPPPFLPASGGAISPSAITVFGETLENNGNLYAALATGTRADVPFRFSSASNTGFTLNLSGPQKVSIVFRNSGTLTHRETNGPGGKVYGYDASQYDQVISLYTGTNRLGADNPPHNGYWFNFEECSAIVPTNSIFDSGWHWHRDVRKHILEYNPTNQELFVQQPLKDFESHPPGTGEGNDSLGGPEDAVPDGNRLILNPDAPNLNPGTNYVPGTVLAKRFYAREWLTHRGVLASEIVRWRSFSTIRLGTNGAWSRFGTGLNFIDLTPPNDPEQPAASVTNLLQQILGQ